MTLRCVPIEPDRMMLDRLAGQPLILAAGVEAECRAGYKAMLAAAPPPPADIAEALELAKRVQQGIGPYTKVVIEDMEVLASALLQSWGRE